MELKFNLDDLIDLLRIKLTKIVYENDLKKDIDRIRRVDADIFLKELFKIQEILTETIKEIKNEYNIN